MYINRFHNVHIKTIWLKLFLHFCNLFYRPHFSRQFMMQCPHDARHTRNLFDISKADLVIALAIPAETHLHWHIFFPLNLDNCIIACTFFYWQFKLIAVFIANLAIPLLLAFFESSGIPLCISAVPPCGLKTYSTAWGFFCSCSICFNE